MQKITTHLQYWHYGHQLLWWGSLHFIPVRFCTHFYVLEPGSISYRTIQIDGVDGHEIKQHVAKLPFMYSNLGFSLTNISVMEAMPPTSFSHQVLMYQSCTVWVQSWFSYSDKGVFWQIYFLDTQVWYTVVSALLGGLEGARDKLGEVSVVPKYTFSICFVVRVIFLRKYWCVCVCLSAFVDLTSEQTLI